MATKKTIAILGASGQMGAAIAKSLSKGNDRLLLMSGNADKLNNLAEEIKAISPNADFETLGCAFDASWEADIIILAVPYHTEKEIAEKIKEVAAGKVVISIANPLNETYTALTTSPGTSAAEELQKLLPHSIVIKAFNTTYATTFEQPVIDGNTIDTFIAGNNEEALVAVAALVKQAGFNPLIAGDLTTSRTLENMQSLLINLGRKYNYEQPIGWKILHN